MPLRVKILRRGLERGDELALSAVERNPTLIDIQLRIFKLGLPDHDQNVPFRSFTSSNLRTSVIASSWSAFWALLFSLAAATTRNSTLLAVNRVFRMVFCQEAGNYLGIRKNTHR
jgi:hypothetical protein